MTTDFIVCLLFTIGVLALITAMVGTVLFVVGYIDNRRRAELVSRSGKSAT